MDLMKNLNFEETSEDPLTLNDVLCQTEAVKSKTLRSLPSYLGWGIRGIKFNALLMIVT